MSLSPAARSAKAVPAMGPDTPATPMTVAEQLARLALGLTFEVLPDAVVKQAKRLALDTLASPMLGFGSTVARIEEDVARELGGTPESTVIGSGLKTSCINAARVNGVMLRMPDYQDSVVYEFAPGKYVSAGHPSEVLPGTLAVGERQHSSGKDVILAIVLAYEIICRFQAADLSRATRGANTPRERGWQRVSGEIAAPLVVGKLLGLTEEQVANAVGVSTCHSLQLGVLAIPWRGEQTSMARNLRWPWNVCNGIMAALEAQKGLTGPRRVLEGPEGLIEMTMGGQPFEFEKLTQPEMQFHVMNVIQKVLPCDGDLQGTATTTLALVKEHDIRAEDVASVKVRAFVRIALVNTSPALRRPTTREMADHSSYYTTAIAIMDRALGMEQYAPEKMADPKVHDLMDKIEIEGDPDFGRNEAVIEITTKQGKTYRSHVRHPRGFVLNPMTDVELEEKFGAAASSHMSDKRIKSVVDAVWGLDDLTDIGNLMRLLVF